MKHIILNKDYHKAIKLVAITKGVTITEAVHSILLNEQSFRTEYLKVRKNS